LAPCVCRKQIEPRRENSMAYGMEAHELATTTEDRRQLAAEVRKLASLLESEEPDYLVLHDAWEDLIELAEQTERVRAKLFRRQPAQEAWLIEKRPWLNPQLELIGKAKKPAGDRPGSRHPTASRSRGKEEAGPNSA
jgi:hypothetical protein